MNIVMHNVSGVSQQNSGDYDFGLARMWLPRETTIGDVPTVVGEIRYITSSGALVVWDGSEWANFTMGTPVPPVNSGFSPLDSSVSGKLVAWYDAALSPNSLVNTSGISVWNDLSLNGYNLNDNDNNPPIGDDNGVSGIFLNGTSQLLSSTGNSEPASSLGGSDKPITIFIAYRALAPASVDTTFCLASNVSNVTNMFATVNNTKVHQVFKRDSASLAASIDVGGAVGETDFETDGQLTTYLHNGTEIAVYASGAAAQPARSGMDVAVTTFNWFTIGALNRFGFGKSLYFNCVVYGVAMFSSGLSSSDRISIERNFAERYNIPMSGYSDNV